MKVDEIYKIIPPPCPLGEGDMRNAYATCVSLWREIKREEDKNNTMQENPSELPPFVKTWKQFYYLLFFWLVILIALFYAFTKYFQ